MATNGIHVYGIIKLNENERLMPWKIAVEIFDKSNQNRGLMKFQLYKYKLILSFDKQCYIVMCSFL